MKKKEQIPLSLCSFHLQYCWDVQVLERVESVDPFVGLKSMVQDYQAMKEEPRPCLNNRQSE
jgi:hypothetical protein